MYLLFAAGLALFLLKDMSQRQTLAICMNSRDYYDYNERTYYSSITDYFILLFTLSAY